MTGTTTTIPTGPSGPTGPTGRRETRDGVDTIAFTRTFAAPMESVWAAVTESDRLERWIGTWRGDPADGFVLFHMNAEGDDVPEETFTITTCTPPRRLVLDTHSPADNIAWHMELDLAEADGVTTLTFSQSVPEPAMAGGVGPGWDYYLDRLVAAESGADVGAIDFDSDYYPAMEQHYLDVFSD